MDAADALRVLGLDGPVEASELKRTYRRLARELHPDAGGDPARFRAVQDAYDAIVRAAARSDGPTPPQQRSAGVETRFWEAAGAWHEPPVERLDRDLTRERPARAERVDVDLLASLLLGASPVAPLRIHSRSPGSRLHRVVSWLQPDLLASLTIAPATRGPRPGHDVDVVLACSAGRGRRVAAEAAVPSGWNRRRGSETVWLERLLRPSRDPADTAVRVACTVKDLTSHLGWPLEDWFVLPIPDARPL